MRGFREILELSKEEIKRLVSKDPLNLELLSALVIKKFMDRYHLRKIDTTLDQFIMFKKAQGKLISLSEEEERALVACLNKIKENRND